MMSESWVQILKRLGVLSKLTGSVMLEGGLSDVKLMSIEGENALVQDEAGHNFWVDFVDVVWDAGH